MPKPEHLAVVEEALRSRKCCLHAFCSGGGLRVVRIDANLKGEGGLIAYGEHPVLSQAFRIIAEDYKAGGRPYSNVYGKIEDEYLTGSYSQEDKLEEWIFAGHTFDSYEKDGQIVVELNGLEVYDTPQDIADRAIDGETVTWTDPRGVVRQAVPSRFPSGTPCCSIQIMSMPEGMTQNRAHIWRAIRRASAPTLKEAIVAAFVAKKVEIPG